jgi:ABC-type bacteriocin/lantibiotic exporter with double-glycine peptidase domain
MKSWKTGCPNTVDFWQYSVYFSYNPTMRYAVVLQHTEEDCGAACLATIAKHFGHDYGLAQSREAVGTTAMGTTLLGLRRGAEALGFIARSVRASDDLLERIHEVPLPGVIHWKGTHWVVLYGVKGSKFSIMDPAIGLRHVDRDELEAGWTNRVMLLLQPDATRAPDAATEVGKDPRSVLRKFWPGWSMVSEITAINMAIGLLALAFPIMTQLLTDDVLVRGDEQLLVTVVIVVLVLNLFQSGMRFAQSMLIGHFGQRMQLQLILEFGSKLLRLPMTYFDGHRSGEVVSRLQDISRINALISEVIFGLPSQTFVAIVSLLVMTLYSLPLTLMALAAFSVVILLNVFFIPVLRQKLRSLIVQGTENQGFLVETFRGALTLKTGNATPQAWEEYQKNFGRITNLRWSAMKLGLYRDSITGLIASLTALMILWRGGQLVMEGELSIGQLIAFYGLSLNFFSFVGGLVQLTDDFIGAKVVMERLSGILDVPAEGTGNLQKPWVTLSADADITCGHLNFHHTGRTELIRDLNHVFAGGAVTALVGPSGCGKTTFAKLIAGLYQHQSGNIRYGKYNQADLRLDCLRQQIILVPQDPHFWSRSILENFRFVFPAVDFTRIVGACEITGADTFISELPDKYQTVLGEFGANLSGGQKQRLALARGLIADPPVLILDEATDSLDPASEDQVMDNLLEIRRGKTTILISHRPDVIQRADHAVVMDKGLIIWSGSSADYADNYLGGAR